MKTIIELFETSVSKYANNIYLWEKQKGNFEGITYRQTRDLVFRFGAGLMALGIQKGDRVGLLSEGRNAWMVSELGILYAGGANVPLSVKLEAAAEPLLVGICTSGFENLEYILWSLVNLFFNVHYTTLYGKNRSISIINTPSYQSGRSVLMKAEMQ